MKKLERFLAVFLFIMLCFGIYTIAEEITLTTYYPAPYGVYKELTTTEKTCLATSSGNVGIGTTAPACMFDIQGAQGYVRIKSTTGTNYSLLSMENTGGSFYYGRDSSTGGGLATGSSAYAGVINAQGTYPLQIAVNNAIAMTILNGGNVGIDTTNPTAKLHVNGNIKANLGTGSPPANMQYNLVTGEILGYDVAEIFNTSEEVEVGDILVIDETKDFKLRKSQSPYEKGIIGIVSGSPAILFEGSQLEIAPSPGGFTKGTKPPVALCGRILCKVSIENGPIERGDFLTSSSTPGHAMRAKDRDKSFGTIVGKALQPFNNEVNGEQTGKILVLVTLQ